MQVVERKQKLPATDASRLTLSHFVTMGPPPRAEMSRIRSKEGEAARVAARAEQENFLLRGEVNSDKALY